MCEPMTLGSIAFSALTTGAQYLGARQAAKDQNRFNAEQARQGEKNAKDAYIFNTNQENVRTIQEEQANSFEVQRIKRERLQKQGEALASSSSAGVPVDQLEQEYQLQESNYISALEQEMEFKRQQSRANVKGYQAQYKDRVASYAYNPVQGPSLVGAAAGLGSKSLSAYQTFKKDPLK